MKFILANYSSLLFYRNLCKDGVFFEVNSNKNKHTYDYYENEFFDQPEKEEMSDDDGFEAGAPGRYNFQEISSSMVVIDEEGLIKKRTIREGSGEKISAGI